MSWFRCRCGHPRAVHRHYRRGSDCGLCGCGRFAHVRRRAAREAAATAVREARLRRTTVTTDGGDRE